MHLLGQGALKCSLLGSRLAAAPSSMLYSRPAVLKAVQDSTAVSADTCTSARRTLSSKVSGTASNRIDEDAGQSTRVRSG